MTGLRPAQGLGYADFLVDPGKTYNLYIGSPTGVPLATLDIAPCESDSGTSGWSKFMLRSDTCVAP